MLPGLNQQAQEVQTPADIALKALADSGCRRNLVDSVCAAASARSQLNPEVLPVTSARLSASGKSIFPSLDGGADVVAAPYLRLYA